MELLMLIGIILIVLGFSGIRKANTGPELRIAFIMLILGAGMVSAVGSIGV